jgi:hypothetical protein
MKLMISKKGFMQAVSDTVFALIVVFIGIFLLTILSKANENKKIAQGEQFMNQAILDNNIALYFKQPVEIDGMKLTMADLIVLTAETGNKDYEKQWEGLSWNYFSKLGFNMLRLRVFVSKTNCNFNCAIFGGKLSDEFPIGATPHTSKLPDVHSITYLPSYSRLLKVEIMYSPS